MTLDQARALVPSPPPALRGPRPTRVLIVTGSYGAGHDAAAHEIQDRMSQAGLATDIVDIARLFPLALGQLLRRAYFAQLELAPGTWGALLRALEPDGDRQAPTQRRASTLIGRLPARALASAVCAETSLIISTHPFASQALGLLRERGQLKVPAVTYLTDASVHPLWIHRSVDLHIAIHEEAARQTRQLGAGGVQLVEPLTPRVAAAHGSEGAILRADLGLPPQARVALISSGSEGVGQIQATARDVRATGIATPVVLCGHNERLRRKLEGEHGVVAVGWLDGLTDAIRGSDCVIQNSGGFTTLEALALGAPLISYRPLPGHGEASAEALRREGLAPWPRNIGQLAAAITDASSGLRPALTQHWAERRSLADALRGVLPHAAPVALAG